MSEESRHPYREDLSAYALGALDADEIPALESHLRGCADCQAELADIQSVKAALLRAIPPKMPSSRVRRKLAAQLPSARKRTFGMVTRLFGESSLQGIAALAAILLLFGLNWYSNAQIGELRRQQADLLERVSSDQEIVSLLADPGMQVLQINADVDNLTGWLLIDKAKNTAVLLLWNLPELEAGQTYQIWLFDAQGTRISVGIFIPAIANEYTAASIEAPTSFGEFIGVGVTIEPLGGSEQPTGPRVFSVDI